MARNNTRVALIVVAFVVGMFGLAYASVPLYRLFCKVTGFGGTTQIAIAPSTREGTRTLTVQFDANVSPDLPWIFKPDTPKIQVKVGSNMVVSYTAENTSSSVTEGMATFNVTPQKAGMYFNKVQCFCFNKQVLQPKQKVSMPITFFIDPALEQDPNMQDVTTVTLSYTFFKAKP